jgi:hypothetical protein
MKQTPQFWTVLHEARQFGGLGVTGLRVYSIRGGNYGNAENGLEAF